MARGRPFNVGNKIASGGKRPGAGRKPREIAELHRRLFDPARAGEAHARLMDAVEAGESWAIIYVLDRTFGRPRPAVEAEAEGELRLVVEYVHGLAAADRA